MNSRKLYISLIISLFISVQLFSQTICEPTEYKKANKLFEKANDAKGKGDYRTALSYLNKAVDEEESYYEAWYSIASINNKPRYASASLRKAVEAYEQVINICPSYENFSSYFYAGIIYYQGENWAKSVDYIKIYLDSMSLIVEPIDDSKRSESRAKRASKKAVKNSNEAEAVIEWARFFNIMYNNPVPFNPVKVKGISTNNPEYQISLSPDNQLAFFTRKIRYNRPGAFGNESRMKEYFFISEKQNGIYSVGEKMPSEFNEFYQAGSSTFSLDNTEMFFSACVILGTRDQRYINCDIYTAIYEFGYWGGVKKVEMINNEDSWESTPTLSSDGQQLYFSSNRDGGEGNTDIWCATRDANGDWQLPKNLGKTINTPGNEMAPFIHPDNSTLYFTSSDVEKKTGEYFTGHKGLGKHDVFIARKDSLGNWKEPMNVGYPINTSEDDLGFFVSSDGTKAYFSSNRLSENKDWDIYEFELYEAARPEKILLVTGVLEDVINTNEPLPEDIKIELKNVKTKQIYEIKVNHETGKYAAVVRFSNDFVMSVKSEDYAYKTEYFSAKDPKNLQPQQIEVKMERLQIGKSYNLNDIYYNTNSDTLTDESIIVIEGFVDYLKDFQNLKVGIHGHTDNIGSKNKNLELSEMRAHKVYETMVSMGIESNRITYKGFGEGKPIAENTTEEGRARNRRTEFVIISK